ncbi:MAG: 16S rRNA (cytosine(967)-C(5))-methyltransferase RsmB [Verrucomicrobiota bacterium]
MEPSSLNAVNGKNPREIAARLLQHRANGGDFIENLLDRALAGSRLSSADRGLCQELVYGVVRWQAALDFLIEAKTPGRTQKPALQTFLRLGLYQIFWLDRIPNHAAVNETVEQAKHSGFGPQAGFINAILRGYLREFDATKALLETLRQTRPAIGHSQPEWLIERWQKRWGAEKTAALLEWNNTPPQTFARVNTLAAGQKDDLPRSAAQPAGAPSGTSEAPPSDEEFTGQLLEQWRNEDVDYDFVRRDWFGENLVFELRAHPPLATLPSFQRGGFYVQDPSTLLAVRELNPQPGETVLDLCAAPGGKTTYIAQRMRNQGGILAHDPVPDRLKLIEENCRRLAVTCVKTTANLEPGTKNQTFDRILIDAPCSNTGVLRRRVDLRWRIRPEEIDRLRATQLSLLRQAAPLLKPGGTLVYSTCSLEPDENQRVVEEFLSGQTAFKLENQRELVPFVDQVDGAFVARMVRVS